MKKEDLYKEIGLLDGDIIEEADKIVKNGILSTRWVKIVGVAASLVLILGIGFWSFLYMNTSNSGIDKLNSVTKFSMSEYLSPEQIFHERDTVIFKGTVEKIKNIEINALVQIRVEKVYRGNLKVDDTISVLLPCCIDTDQWVEDTETVSAMREGMTGIFMPTMLDDKTIASKDGATLYDKELADYVFFDGERFAFLETSKGLVFDRWTYPALQGCTTLDQVEAYVLSMIKE